MTHAQLSRSLALALALALVALLAACVQQPTPQASVTTSWSTTKPLVFAQPSAMPSSQPATHVRVRNVGEAGSLLQVEVRVPAGLGADVGQVSLGAFEAVDITFTAIGGSSRDDVVTISTNRGDVPVPVRIVMDDGVICGPAAASSSLTAGRAQAPASPSLETVEADGIEVLVVYDDVAARTAAVPEVARRQLADRALQAVGGQLMRPGTIGEHDLVRVADQAAIERLRARPDVRYVVENVSVYRLAGGDPSLSSQWWATGFGAEAGWAEADGSDADVVVAIIDDGINVDHVDLADKALQGCDLFDYDGDVRYRDSDHGSHVAGIALASGGNGAGIRGMASGPSVQLLPVKVFPDDPIAGASLDSLIRGIRWAAGLSVYGVATNEHPADVINLSLGFGRTPSSSTIDMFQELVNDIRAGAGGTKPLFVAAAGNQRPGEPDEDVGNGVEYPARLSGVLAVGAVDSGFARSSFSYYGTGLDLMAAGGRGPNDNTMACHDSTANGYSNPLISLGARSSTALVCLSGTSMAAPVVAGIAAVLISDDPASFRDDPDALTQQLRTTAFRPSGSTQSDEYGDGIVCLDAALETGTVCGTPTAP